MLSLKFASDLGLGSGFRQVLLHYLQLASHELATIGINVTKNKIPNPNAWLEDRPVSRLQRHSSHVCIISV